MAGRKKDPALIGSKVITVQVDPALKVALEEQAWRERKSVSALIRQLLTSALELDVPVVEIEHGN